MHTVKFLIGIPLLFAVLFFGMALKAVKVIGDGILIALATTTAYLWEYKTPEECPFVRGMLMIHFTSSSVDEEASHRSHHEGCSST